MSLFGSDKTFVRLYDYVMAGPTSPSVRCQYLTINNSNEYVDGGTIDVYVTHNDNLVTIKTRIIAQMALQLDDLNLNIVFMF